MATGRNDFLKNSSIPLLKEYFLKTKLIRAGNFVPRYHSDKHCLLIMQHVSERAKESQMLLALILRRGFKADKNKRRQSFTS